MASTQIATSTFAPTFGHGRQTVLASSRWWALFHSGTDLLLYYSDNDGSSWTSHGVVDTADFLQGSLVYDAVNGRLNVCYAAYNGTSTALQFRAVTTNVASGVPGALTTEVLIDAGGAGAGVLNPFILHSATVTNPRYWIIAQKFVTPNWETRVWYATAGVAADTGANWVTTNFTNLGANASTSLAHDGLGVWWTVGGLDKITFVLMTAPGIFESVTFDPTAASPTPGATTAVGTGYGSIDYATNVGLFAISAKADYLIWGALDTDVSTWTFRKTVNGTAWTDPSGWSGLAMSRCQISLANSGDFYAVHSTPYALQSNADSPLAYRKITAATDTMGAGIAFSDAEGNNLTAPIAIGTKVRALYRNGTASPFSVRSDFTELTAVQSLRPDADVTTTGWTTPPLWSKLDETPAGADIVSATAS